MIHVFIPIEFHRAVLESKKRGKVPVLGRVDVLAKQNGLTYKLEKENDWVKISGPAGRVEKMVNILIDSKTKHFVAKDNL